MEIYEVESYAHQTPVDCSACKDDSASAKRAAHATSPVNMDGIVQANGTACHHSQSTIAACSGTMNGSTFDHEPEVLEPIAIIGISQKFPQEAVNGDSFWKMLVSQRCASTEFPKDRLNIDAFYNPDPRKQSRVRCYFLLFSTIADDGKDIHPSGPLLGGRCPCF